MSKRQPQKLVFLVDHFHGQDFKKGQSAEGLSKTDQAFLKTRDIIGNLAKTDEVSGTDYPFPTGEPTD